MFSIKFGKNHSGAIPNGTKPFIAHHLSFFYFGKSVFWQCLGIIVRLNQPDDETEQQNGMSA
jgi:hypothetical protein